jgi:pimeloyl-ACP methyl ester carboxylesterase
MPSVASVNAQIEIKRFGRGSPEMLAAACSGIAAFRDLEAPYVEMNLRGFGASKAVRPNEFQIADYMSDFDAAMDSVKSRQSVIFGYSHAGYFAARYAISRASRVSGLILAEPALYTDPQDLERRARLAEQGDGLGSIDAMLRYVQGGAKSKNVNVANSILKNIQNNDVLAREFRLRAQNPISAAELHRLRMPVLLIGGTESNVRFMVEKGSQDIPNATVWWVRGATHLTLLDAKYSKQISRVVGAFLENL